MANPRNKWIEAVVKLIELTQEGKIKWSADQPPPSLRRIPEQKVDLVFNAQYNGQNLRLYERFYKDPLMERDGFWSIFGRPKESPWQSKVVLEFVDDRGRAFWFFPSVNPLNDLLSSVKYQLANINKFIDELLKEGVNP